MIRRPPGAPIVRSGLPSGTTSVGVGAHSVRLRGLIEFTRPGSGSNQVMPLFSRMPVPLATTADPNNSPSVDVHATMLRSASTTFTCVVQPSPPALLLALGRPLVPAAAGWNRHGSPALAQGSARSGAIVA